MSGPGRVRLLVAELWVRPPLRVADFQSGPDWFLSESLYELLLWLDFQRCEGTRFWAVSIGHGCFRRGYEPLPGELFAPDVWERGELLFHRPRVWRPEHFWGGSDDMLAAMLAAAEDDQW